MRRPRGSLTALAGASLLFSVLASRPAFAEASAADKAAARQAATEGLQLFESQKYADALDRLRRAQALYDAPVHLLYIARAEEKLGLLVEASEHYRQLDHYTLPPKPPEAWADAVEDGRKELAALEPRVPNLRVLTEPPTSNAALRIDGSNVSSAAIGIPRPINPGKHTVELAPQGKPFLATEVTVAEGTTRDVVFRVDGSAPHAAATTSVATSETAATPAEGANEGPFVGFLGGVRLGLAVPYGTYFNLADQDFEASDFTSAGLGIEFHAGLRLGKYFTPIFFLEGSSLGHPDTAPIVNRQIKTANSGSFGIGVLVGTPPGKVGGFGEFDIGLLELTSVQFAAGPLGATECKVEARGQSLRFGGGGTIPLSKYVLLTPVLLASFGRYSNLDQGCAQAIPADIPTDNQRTHGMLFLGVGGDIVIGGRR